MSSTESTAATRRRPLMLLHGAGGGVSVNYAPLLEGLADTHEVFGLDYPGAGDQPRSADPLTLDDLVDAAIADADRRGVETFALAGYSLGTSVAIRLASRYPDRVESLVLTAGFAALDTSSALAIDLWKLLYEAGDAQALGEYMLSVASSRSRVDSLSLDQVRAIAGGLGASFPAGTADHLDLVHRVDVRGELASIAVPTLVVITAQDRLISPQVQVAVAEGIERSEIVRLESGHLPFLETPHEWADAVARFLG